MKTVVAGRPAVFGRSGGRSRRGCAETGAPAQTEVFRETGATGDIGRRRRRAFADGGGAARPSRWWATSDVPDSRPSSFEGFLAQASELEVAN